jgi:glycosyltransferase involved in cell wall biosynthesis
VRAGLNRGTSALPGKALILVENLSVPFDRRVWQECTTLRRAGWDVHVICPRGARQDTEAEAEIDGVHIHRYSLRQATGGPAGYLAEYGSALRNTVRLARRVGPVDVVHACNPPDLFFVVALLLKQRGARFIFDQHDLVPELYLSRFSRGRDALYRAVRFAERLTYRAADVVIATNESYREVAMARGRKRPEDVFVVRSAPAVERFRQVRPEPALKRGKPHLLCYNWPSGSTYCSAAAGSSISAFRLIARTAPSAVTTCPNRALPPRALSAAQRCRLPRIPRNPPNHPDTQPRCAQRERSGSL